LVATHFSFEELTTATDSFRRVHGEGAFGTVYLGQNIRNSATSVAVKMLNEVYIINLISVYMKYRLEKRLSKTKMVQLNAELSVLTK
jgi:serine/threonine protein kinase